MRETHVDLQSQGIAKVVNYPIVELPFEYTITSRSTDVCDIFYMMLITEIAFLCLGVCLLEQQRQFELQLSVDMIQELRSMFEKQQEWRKFELNPIFPCLQTRRRPIQKYAYAKGKNKDNEKGMSLLDLAEFAKEEEAKLAQPDSRLTPPYTPQHNGCLKEKPYFTRYGRSMMNSYNSLPLPWDYALESATRILNMVPTKKVDKTPYELWYGKVPNLSYLKVWGCEALVKRDTPDKLEQRSVKCIFIGYPKETMGYYFYFPPENKIVVARYVEFFEKRLISQEISGRAVDLEEIQEEEDTTPSEITSNIPQEVEGFEPPQEEVIPIRRSERPHRAPNRLCLNVEVEEHSLGDLNEPASYKAAMLDSESNKWIDAMNAEIQSMMDNMVWVLVDLPPGCKTVGSRWLFKKKTDMDGIVHVYKARLVAKGYTQLYGVDYEETFSPVADIRAIRILISIAAYYDYEIWQMDVKTAFLNGYLDEDIYMVQPEGFVDPNHPRKVCKLQRSIYGLKQASRSWNKRFDEEIKRFGFAQNLDEPCVYQKASGSNVTFLILYVDDIIIMGNHIPSLQSVKDYLGKCFAMKDLGEAAFILGIKIYRDRSKRLIGLCQNAYMDKILKRYKMDNSKRGHIPMQERLDLNKSQGAQTPKEVNRMKNVPYASAVGIHHVCGLDAEDLNVAFAAKYDKPISTESSEPSLDCCEKQS
ncbi:retrotransposon protein, putative, ty1-copia subclass [Tanacetum coccineum]|uniref:Retrotransposon protein, putative, ty1-copia subclass n=1 Tax=Tanacetum coccineum TaxID=301880 RepID=A0ABQ5FN46_9ASTR